MMQRRMELQRLLASTQVAEKRVEGD